MDGTIAFAGINMSGFGDFEISKSSDDLLEPDDLSELAEKKIEAAKQLYPDRQDFYFGIASMSMYDKLLEKARELGIFLLTQKVVEVCNDTVRAF